MNANISIDSFRLIEKTFISASPRALFWGYYGPFTWINITNSYVYTNTYIIGSPDSVNLKIENCTIPVNVSITLVKLQTIDYCDRSQIFGIYNNVILHNNLFLGSKAGGSTDQMLYFLGHINLTMTNNTFLDIITDSTGYFSTSYRHSKGMNCKDMVYNTILIKYNSFINTKPWFYSHRIYVGSGNDVTVYAEVSNNIYYNATYSAS